MPHLPTRNLKFFFCLLLLSIFDIQAIPIMVQLGTNDTPQDYLRVQIAGREHAEEFSNVNQLIASGNGAELVKRATTVLASDPDSGLAYEALGVGQLILKDLPSAIKAFENAARLDAKNSAVFGKLGLALMENDQIESAEQAFLSALRISPDDAFANRNLGLLYDYLDKPDLAISRLLLGLKDSGTGNLFEAVTLARLLNGRQAQGLAINILEPRVPVSSGHEAAQVTLATSYIQAERWTDALARFERALELNPGAALSRLGQAVALRGAGQQQKSIEILQGLRNETAIKQAVAVEFALSLLSAGREQDANVALQDAIRLGANPDVLDESVARQLVRDKKFDEARIKYQSLLDRKVGSPQIYVHLSELLFAEGKTAESLAVLESGRERFPENGYLSFRTGSHHASLGDYDKAIPEFLKADKQSPKNRDTLRALGLAYTRSGKHSEAVTTAESLLAIFPEDVDLLVEAALAYERADRAADAIRTYEKILTKQPKNPLVLNNLANLVLVAGDVQRASGLIETATETVTDNALILDTLGYVRLQQNNLPAALDALQKAAELAPELGVVQYHLGLVYMKMKKPADARVAFNQAVSLTPDASWVPEIKRHLTSITE